MSEPTENAAPPAHSSVLANVVTAVVLAWVCLFVSTVWWIGSEALTIAGSTPCERGTVEQSNNVEGSATWSWIPPGKVCHYPDGVTTRPSTDRGLLLAALVVTGPLVYVLVRRRRRQQS